MDRYLPLAAALLALPHLLSIAIRDEPAAAAAARTPRAVAAQAPPLTAHCTASVAHVRATAQAPMRTSLLRSVRTPARAAGAAAIAPGTYLQR